jgi:nucleotide-binding universal stress UspA family protein
MKNAEANGTGAPDGSVLAYVDETGQYDHVLRTARTLAREHDARLILYHSVANGQPGESVRIPDAHAADASSPQALSANELRSASRPILAVAVEEARDDGIDAWGWLAPDPGVGPLMRYAEQVNAEVVVLPAELGDTAVFANIRGEQLQVALESGTVNVVIVDREGRLVGPG